MIIRPRVLFRGIRLAGHKSPTQQLPAERIAVPTEVAIPLSQHAGAPAQPIVEAGQAVKRGELIAVSAGNVSSNIHASVSGTVKEVGARSNGCGGKTDFIVITASETQEDAFLPALKNPTSEEIISRIEECGIVGMGGAGFPTHVKLRPTVAVDTLILNGAECEPYLTCDDALMQEKCAEIVRGAKYLAKALNVSRILIAIEQNKPAALALFEKTDLDVVPLKKKYPMGSEKQLIYCCTGRKVPLGKLPAHVGVIVQNVATAYAVCEAVEQGKPLIERIVTVTGGAIAQPKNLLCPGRHAPLGARRRMRRRKGCRQVGCRRPHDGNSAYRHGSGCYQDNRRFPVPHQKRDKYGRAYTLHQLRQMCRCMPHAPHAHADGILYECKRV